MGYTKPIYDEVEVNEVPEPQTRSKRKFLDSTVE